MYKQKHQLTIDETKFIILNWDKMTPEELVAVLKMPSVAYVNAIATQIRKSGYPLARKSTSNRKNSVKNIIKQALVGMPSPDVNA
jgi:hypothetical protein